MTSYTKYFGFREIIKNILKRRAVFEEIIADGVTVLETCAQTRTRRHSYPC
jgi:hypothetical protein